MKIAALAQIQLKNRERATDFHYQKQKPEPSRIKWQIETNIQKSSRNPSKGASGQKNPEEQNSQ